MPAASVLLRAPAMRAPCTSVAFAAFVALVALAAAPARAQGVCGAAGGAPPGPGTSVCDWAAEATGAPPAPGPATGAGNPVDVVTGNKHLTELDLRLGAAPALAFARHYNSANRHAGALGVGWSHTWEVRLAHRRVAARDEVQVVQADGRRFVFERTAARRPQWRGTHPSHGIVDAGAGEHRWHWRHADGRIVHFDARGRIVAVSRDGRLLARAWYDAHDRLQVVGGPLGTELRFAYLEHPQGVRLASVADAHRERLALHYDAAGQLVAARPEHGPERRYAYDDPHDPLRLTRVDELDGPTVPPRTVARVDYEPGGRVRRTVDAAGTELRLRWSLPERPDGIGLTEVADPSGRTASYRWRYDARRHASRLIEASGEPCTACPPAPRRYGWSASGHVQRIEAPEGTLLLTHDRLGRPLSAALATGAGAAPAWRWRVRWPGPSALGWPAQVEQPSVAPGRVHRIRIESDARGRVVAVHERGYAPAPSGWLPIERRFALRHRESGAGSAAQPPHRGEPDRLTGLAAIDGPLPGPADAVALAQHDRALHVHHPHGLVQRWLFEHGLLVHDRAAARAAGAVAVAPAPGPDAEPAPALRALALHRGRPTAVALPDGSVWRRGFDDFGRVAWIEPPGEARQWAAYDQADRLVRHQHGDGSVLHHGRDAAGRLLSTVLRPRAGPPITLGRYRWRGAQLVEAATDAVAIAYGYDALGRLASVEHRFADRPDEPLRWAFDHDGAGRVVAETLPGGLVVHYRHAGADVVGLRIEGPGGPPVDVDAAPLREPLVLRDATAPAAPAVRAVLAGGRLLQAAGMTHLPDPHGRRAGTQPVEARGAHPARRFVHHDWRLRAERSADGALRQWLWAGARPVVVVEGGRVLRVVTDGRAAPVRALDADGRAVWSAAYDRAGAAVVAAGAEIDLALRLPGQYRDAHSGWHHNHHRTYLPGTGRYLEPDPLGLQPGHRGRDDLYAYAGGDPIDAIDPWGLARLTWFALTTGADGRGLGRVQGFDRARWSFMVEDILPVASSGRGLAPPQPAGVDGLLFDPWGDFVGGRDDPGLGTGNGIDAIAWTGLTGRQVFAAFAAHYGGALAGPERFVVDGFDDRRAGALARILAAAPSQRQPCVAQVLGALPGLALAPAQPLVRPAAPDAPHVPAPPPAASEPARLLDCHAATALPVAYRDDAERSRVERYQAAAELQESPAASIASSCAANAGCRTRARIEVNGRAYHASYGRTQFTVTTFLAELARLTAPEGGAEAAALRSAIGLNLPAAIAGGGGAAEGSGGTLADALALARARVDASYRTFAALRAEFGRGLSAEAAAAAWDALPAGRRAAFAATTGLGRDGFLDMLGYVATGTGGRTEEEGRHALAASAAATVEVVVAGHGAPVTMLDWLVALFASRDPYDHVSRAFLRDHLRRVLAAPALAGRFDNPEPPGTPAWDRRQQLIELDLARRVAVLHNAGRLDLALRPDLDRWLEAHRTSWVAGYVAQFTTADGRGNFETLRCAAGLGGRAGLQFTALRAMPPSGVPP
jgi:RHS repeat-associated protein